MSDHNNPYKSLKRALTLILPLTLALGTGACSSVTEGYDDGRDASSSQAEAPDDKEIGLIALQSSWDNMSSSDQKDLCDGYVLIPDEIVDIVREGNEQYLTKADTKTFLDGECL